MAPTRYVTGLVDLERGRLLDLVAGRSRAAVDRWLGAQRRDWLAGIATVALDPWRGYASALTASLGHATMVVDHFHAIRLANTVVDQVRRRVQQTTLGHRGRKHDPLHAGSTSGRSPPGSGSPSQDKRGCGLGWRLGIRPARSSRPGRATSCSEPSTPRPVRRRPVPRWSASTAGQTASG
jgi:Transposase